MRVRGIAALAMLALAACTGNVRKADAPDFDFARYTPVPLAEAETPADGICSIGTRPVFTTDMALTPMRLKAAATQRFRPVANDADFILAAYDKSAAVDWRKDYDEEVAVNVDGQERWLPIQRPVAAFWREELEPGQPVWLYVTRFGCVQPVDASLDRAILSINEYQVEPIGQPELAQ